MAQQKSKLNFGIFTIILLGIVLAVFIVGQQTNWFNKAAGPSNKALTNLNKASEIVSTNNPNGSMGPQTSSGNWSNSLPDFLKGNLSFAVIDPPPVDKGKPDSLPTQAQGRANGLDATTTPKQKNENGPQTVTALNLTITKAEVHMSYQGKPGDKIQNGKVDHWETLNIATPVTLDLVDLAKTKDVSKLGITVLAAGRYNEVRLYLSAATATLEDGKTVNLTVLGKDNIVRVIRSFTINQGQTTTITMDFDAQHSVVKAGDTYLLKPVVARLLEQH